MNRRRFLAAISLGTGLLAGCGSRQPSTPTLTPVPVPETTPTPAQSIRSWLSDVNCPDLDRPTVCAHTLPSDHPIRFRPAREVVTTAGVFQATLVNQGKTIIELDPSRWGVWQYTNDAWSAKKVGGGDEQMNKLSPGQSYKWALDLGVQRIESRPRQITISTELTPSYYALGLPVADRIYAILFGIVPPQHPEMRVSNS